MIQIYVKNVQAIDEYTFKFPDHGIVQFRGNNSNGKSILGKIVSRAVLQMLAYDDKRLPLIQDHKESAILSISCNKRSLVVNIDKDINKTFYGLIRENGEKVIRHIREGGISEILREFGFVVYGKNLVCLQICETFGLMPFINTPDTLNGEIVNSVTTDRPSEQFLENYQITFKEAKSRLNVYKRDEDLCDNAISSRQLKDITGYAELIERAKAVKEKHSYLLHIPQITVQPFPKMEFSIKKVSALDIIEMPIQLHKVNSIYSLDKQIVDMEKIKRGKCPTCGQPMLSKSHNIC